MLDLVQAKAYEERYKDLLRTAQKNHVIHTIHKKSTGPHGIYRQFLVRLGRLLLIWGWRLHAKGSGIVDSPPNRCSI